MVNYIVFRRSLTASLVEFVLYLLPSERYKVDRFYAKHIARARNNYTAPKLHCNVDSYSVDGMPVYELYDKGCTNDKIVLYFHGGAYVAQPMVFQWNFAVKMAKRLGARVVVPMYPLAPEHNCDEAQGKITKLYTMLLDKYKRPIVVLGDSAGGGMALALGVKWQKENVSAPAKLILLSPWLDMTLANERVPGLDLIDPMLSYKHLSRIAPIWAGQRDVLDYHVSPMYANVAPKCKTYIFVGTREIFCPDCIDYYAKWHDKHKNLHLILGVGMNHVYPMYPIPEACKAFRQISNIINEN